MSLSSSIASPVCPADTPNNFVRFAWHLTKSRPCPEINTRWLFSNIFKITKNKREDIYLHEMLRLIHQLLMLSPKTESLVSCSACDLSHEQNPNIVIFETINLYLTDMIKVRKMKECKFHASEFKTQPILHAPSLPCLLAQETPRTRMNEKITLNSAAIPIPPPPPPPPPPPQSTLRNSASESSSSNSLNLPSKKPSVKMKLFRWAKLTSSHLKNFANKSGLKFTVWTAKSPLIKQSAKSPEDCELNYKTLESMFAQVQANKSPRVGPKALMQKLNFIKRYASMGSAKTSQICSSVSCVSLAEHFDKCNDSADDFEPESVEKHDLFNFEEVNLENLDICSGAVSLVSTGAPRDLFSLL
ncbi:hypothetical protein Ciccas_013042 [Cichlidogyrus casuarinus]|uniref:Uncharacterized protein n=1 Tax=Cichlidogyrus casuarinus TaxID=1844966 RepID=A0ABD2PPQ1_9PLAT